MHISLCTAHPCPAQSLVFFRDEDVHLKELLARWTMAFPKVRRTDDRSVSLIQCVPCCS